MSQLLTTCSRCHSPGSEHASFCTRCGAPVGRRTVWPAWRQRLLTAPGLPATVSIEIASMVAMTVGLTVALYPSGAGATRPLSSEAAVGAGATVTVLPTVANPIATAVPSVESTATPPPATAT